jgi:uncharacterized protein YbjT (DUF2867 family)
MVQFARNFVVDLANFTPASAEKRIPFGAARFMSPDLLIPGGFFLPLTGPTVRDRGRIELPFGRGKTNPVAAADVARVVAAVLDDPGRHLGRIYELTGLRSQDMHGVAQKYSDALNREVTYSDIPPRGLGTGAEKAWVAGAPATASGDDGRVEPGGSV